PGRHGRAYPEGRMTPAEAATAAIETVERGQFQEVHERFAPQLRPLLTPDSLRAAWQAAIVTTGPVSTLGPPVTETPAPGTVLVKVPVTFERGSATVAVSLTGDADGWITGIRLLPASAAEPTAPWAPPPYADPTTFTEHEVVVGDGPLAVPGTLSVPHGTRQAPAPGVVLLAGSGPHDQDETIGRNKPLKDLAWGLASAGIAVLRFEKVTLAHPAECAARPAFTLTDEYVPQALAGLRLLSEHPAIDPARLYLAGHSLGGSVAPRIAAAAAATAAGGPAVAGLIILAGGAQPLHWSAATPQETLPFGIPAPYWLDLRGYDPPAAAAALSKPMLIVQGGRDYQATVDDDLSRWDAALGNSPDVTIRVYDADNHLFFPGSGSSSPEEYEPAQHMDPQVIADAAAWLRGPGTALC